MVGSFSTNISTVHLVSLAQEGYANGLAFGNFELMAGFTLILLALFFTPLYIRSQVATLPDFLERRYRRASRDWLAFISIVSAIFIHIGFTLYTAALVMHGLLRRWVRQRKNERAILVPYGIRLEQRVLD
jgi:SSS family solute:Na+ symporter